MPLYKKNIYTQIQQDLKYLYKFANDEEFSKFLIDLRPIASNLYIKLQDEVVEVDYSSEEVQLAYILRYFPGYTEQLYTALYEIRHKQKQFFFELQDEIKFGLFGCGPCPEIIAISNFFEDYSSIKPDKITTHLYDKNSHAWSFIKNNFIYPKYKEIDIVKFGFRIGHKSADFSTAFKLPKQFDNEYYDVCCFQNCLNEFIKLTNEENLKNNIKSVTDSIKQGGFLVISDRTYIKSNALEVEKLLSSRFRTFKKIDKPYDINLKSPIPSIIKNLLNGSRSMRLIPTRWNKRFIWIYQKII